ncbi:MAG: hypothetical protein ACREB8_16515 [Pseudolabrys sp.]
MKTGIETTFVPTLGAEGGAQSARGSGAIVKGLGVLRRGCLAILAALHESRRKQAEREIARFFRQSRQMSDDLERRIDRRLFESDWSPRE